ncbi:MAG: acetolactate synthase small subunit [Candidatus Omnitrophica bacterium]|nr:acetolactate synthase small subunit [Candidatus Omnitrophota bacterium]
MKKHTISVLVENKFGVLARIAGLFSARGFNIDSLAVGETEDPTISRMTIVLSADDRILQQVKKQLNKLIDVIRVIEFTKQECINREIMLIKVSAPEKKRQEILKIVNSVDAEVVDVGEDTITVQETGDESKIHALLELLRPYGIKEIVRSGTIAIGKEGK